MSRIALVFSRFTRILSGKHWERSVIRRFIIAIRSHSTKYLHKSELEIVFDSNIAFKARFSDLIESQILWQGFITWDKGKMELLRALLKEDDVFLDIGANIGVFTLLAAKRLTNGKVHAFEPYTYHTKRLEANLELNGFRNVIVNGIALSNIDSKQKLYVPRNADSDGLWNSGKASLYGANENDYISEEVIAMKLDSYVRAQGVEKIDIIKIDVEGSEMAVLQGADEILDEFKPYVIMEAHAEHFEQAGYELSDLVSFWTHRDYEIYLINGDGSVEKLKDSNKLNGRQNLLCQPASAELDG